MAGKQVTELDALPSFTDNSLLPVHNGTGLKKGLLSQLANYLGTKFSNPNLLINPDFKINQRGATSYERQGYSVDRWKISNVTVTPNANGGITVKNDKYTDSGTFIQILENATEGDSTLSCYVTSVSGTVTMAADDNSQVVLKQGLNVVHTSKSTKNFTIFLNQGTSITLKWVKLEQGTVATAFVAPNYADELVKCQRYYYQFSSRLIMNEYLQDYADGSIYFPTEMRKTPTVIFGECTYFNHTLGFIEPKSIGVNANFFTTKSALMKIERNANDKFTIGYSINAKLNIYFDAEIY